MGKTTAKVMVFTMLTATLASCGHPNSVSTESMAASEKTQIGGAASEVAETKEKGAGAASYRFVFLPNTQNNTFQAAMNDMFKKLRDEKGYGYMCLGPSYDLSAQLSQVADMVTQNFDVAFIIPADSAGIRQGLEQIHKKNIPILNVDTPIIDDDLDLVETVIAADAYNTGTPVGRQMMAGYPNGVKIAMLDFPSNKSYVNRMAGFLDGLGDAKDKFDTVARQDGATALDISMPITEDIIQADPSLNISFCISNPSALGAAVAIRISDKVGIGVYSIDTPPNGKATILDDSFTAIAAQVLVGVTEVTFEKARELLVGDEIEKEVLLSPFLVDKEKAGAALKDWQQEPDSIRVTVSMAGASYKQKCLFLEKWMREWKALY